MIRKKPFLRSVSYLLLLTMTNYIAYPTALAMSFDEATKAGSNSAQSSAGNFVMPSTDGSSSYTFDGIDEPISMGDIFRGVDSLDVDDLKKMADSDSSILNKGVDSQKDLNASESDDPYKQAYDTTKEIFFKKTPDMTNDPMWGQTDDTFGRLDEIANEFADCSVEQTFVKGGSKVTHVPDYKQCNRVEGFSGTLNILHNFEVGVIVHESGPLNLASCGKGCVQMWVGRVGNNYWSGNCKIYEQAMSVKVLNPDAIIKAVHEYSHFDDYHQIWINDEKVYNGPLDFNTFPPETPGRCELDTNWTVRPNDDLTEHFRDVEPNTVIEMKTRTSVTGRGQGYSRIRIWYDPKKAVSNESWYPEDDYLKGAEVVKSVQDGFCSGSWKCDKMMASVNDKGCAEIDGFVVCEDAFEGNPFPGISNFCSVVSVESECGFTEGEVCWEDINGKVNCSETGSVKNTCKPLQDNPDCGFVKTECVGGAAGESGKCYVFEDTYDCGYNVEVDSGGWLEDELVCQGEIKCIDGSCSDVPTDNKNTDFSEAVAMLQLLQHAGKDMECGEGIEDNIVCTIFNPILENDKSYCKIAVGGMQDCCEAPEGVGLGDYLTLISTSMKVDTFLAQEKIFGETYQGVWSLMKEGVVASAEYIAANFASLSDIATGVSDVLTEGATDAFLNEFKQEMMKEAAKFLAEDMGLGAAADLIVKEGANGAMEAGAATQALIYVYYAYLAYVIVNLLVNIIWECTMDELQLASQVELSSCHYLGSYCSDKVLGACVEKRKAYCCYTSPLARIFNEQIRLQLDDYNWGTPENPTCEGIPMNRLDDVNWDLVDLDEWIAIQINHNVFPDPSTATIESLTGDGAAMNFGDERENSLDRNKKRMEDSNFDKTRQDVRDDVHSSYIER